MRKRFSLVTSVVLATSVLISPTAAGSNFNSGALLNSQWTCIDARLSTGGSISEQKFAELDFGPTTVKRDKTFTTVTFTKFNLKTNNYFFTRVALQVFKGTKTYKQSFLTLKSVNGVQKINFTVKVPTKEIKEIVFNVSIQSSKNPKVGGACIPNSVYNSLLPKNEPASSAEDPVLTKIIKRLPDLPKPSGTTSQGEIRWVIAPSAPVGYKSALQAQSDDLASAFPLTYRWNKPATLIVGDLLTWTPDSAALNDECQIFVNRMKTFWKDLPNLDNRLLGGSSYCDGGSIVVIRPNPSAPNPDGDLMAQEIGIEIQANSLMSNPMTAKLSLDELVIPNWYIQAGQSANAFIAHAIKNRSIDGAINKIYLNPECSKVLMKQMRPENKSALGDINCDFNKGFASMRLMIALYGWDATVKWFSGFTSKDDYENAFLKAFGKPLVEFETLSDEYWKFLNNAQFDAKALNEALSTAP
jgi:hypothetical protein